MWRWRPALALHRRADAWVGAFRDMGTMLAAAGRGLCRVGRCRVREGSRGWCWGPKGTSLTPGLGPAFVRLALGRHCPHARTRCGTPKAGRLGSASSSGSRSFAPQRPHPVQAACRAGQSAARPTPLHPLSTPRRRLPRRGALAPSPPLAAALHLRCRLARCPSTQHPLTQHPLNPTPSSQAAKEGTREANARVSDAAGETKARVSEAAGEAKARVSHAAGAAEERVDDSAQVRSHRLTHGLG